MDVPACKNNQGDGGFLGDLCTPELLVMQDSTKPNLASPHILRRFALSDLSRLSRLKEKSSRARALRITRFSNLHQYINNSHKNTMAKGSKLLAALDREKGVNHKLERQKKQQKAAEKRKRARVEEQEDEAVLEDAIKEAEATTAGKKDKKGAKRAKVEQEEEEEDEEEWETDDEDKTHAVGFSRYHLCVLWMVMLTVCARKTLQDWSRTILRMSLIQRTTSTVTPS